MELLLIFLMVIVAAIADNHCDNGYNIKPRNKLSADDLNLGLKAMKKYKKEI